MDIEDRINNSFGKDLDELGKKFGVDRNNNDDATYRKEILEYIKKNIFDSWVEALTHDELDCYHNNDYCYSGGCNDDDYENYDYDLDI